MEDRYEIREKIEQGGFGSIYRGYDHRMKRNVAFKRILTTTEDTPIEKGAAKQIMSEVSTLSSLQHPNIINIYDVGFDEVGSYVIMELLDGKNLHELVKEKPLSWDNFKTVATQSLDALISAHHLGIIHRNLKSSNIMLTSTASGAFQVKILDFTLATLIHKQSREDVKQMDTANNSAYFMSPEQYDGRKLDARSDIYSLGCCFYQILTGVYPYNGKTGVEVMQAHFHHYVRPIQEIRNDIPQWVCEWVMWMISRYPNDRPPTMREALAVFESNKEIYKNNSGNRMANSSESTLVKTSYPQRSTADTGASSEESASANGISASTLIDSTDASDLHHKTESRTITASRGKSKSLAKALGKPLVIGSATAIGRRSLINEDRHLIDPKKGWFAIASSVPDLPHGELASECAFRHLMREIARPDSDKRELSDIIYACHNAVRQLGAFLAPSTGIGANLTLFRFTPQSTPPSVMMAHVGGNVAYRHPASLHPFERISSDHNMNSSPENIASQTQPHFYRYLGYTSPPDCEIRLIPLDSEDRFILCSRGVTRALDDTEIADLSSAKPSAPELARAIIEIADIRGGRANATALVIDIPPL